MHKVRCLVFRAELLSVVFSFHYDPICFEESFCWYELRFLTDLGSRFLDDLDTVYSAAAVVMCNHLRAIMDNSLQLYGKNRRTSTFSPLVSHVLLAYYRFLTSLFVFSVSNWSRIQTRAHTGGLPHGHRPAALLSQGQT